MAFKSFYIRLALRIVILTLLLFYLAYCIMNASYVRSVYMAVFSCGAAAELFFFIRSFTSRISYFIDCMLQRDFTVHFSAGTREKHFRGLFENLNRVTEVFREISAEKEIKHRYLELIVEHVRTGLASFDNEGNVYLVNEAFKNMFGVQRLANIGQLQHRYPEVWAAATQMKPGEKKLIRIADEQLIGTLVLFLSEFRLEDRHYRLISAQNITQELSAAEIEAWQRLIKVLTHEIMNSVSPIMSLSGTLNSMLKAQGEGNTPEEQTLRAGIDAIHARSEGLYGFTQRYRELTRIPAPVFQANDLTALVAQTLNLLKPELAKHKVAVDFKGKSLICSLDATLIQQVLLNLLRNAVDAVRETDYPLITIEVTSKEGRILLRIADNGSGIEPGNLDKVFIPFFTTKQNGSGIGLALSRQIILMHGGDIAIRSLCPGTEFTVML